MNAIFSVIVIFFASHLFAFDGTTQDFEFEYVGLQVGNKSNNTNNGTVDSHYRKTKNLLHNAIFNNDVAGVALIYFVAKSIQKDNTVGATCCAIPACVGVGLAPVTFGLSLMVAAPFTAFTVVTSTLAHKYRKLKRRAKEELSSRVNPHLFEAIMRLSEKGDLCELKKRLQKEGVKVDHMVIKGPGAL